MELDHLAVVARDLDDGAAFVEEALGVPLEPGGRHDLFGTWNRLLGLGPGLYLEVIAPDPAAPDPGRPRWFGIDRHEGPPRLANWIVRVDDLSEALAEAPQDAGEALDLVRGDLRWRIAVPADGSLPGGGIHPTLIEWQVAAHPADRLPDRGVRLRRLVIAGPDATATGRTIVPRLGDPRVVFQEADRGSISADFDTPRGIARLG